MPVNHRVCSELLLCLVLPSSGSSKTEGHGARLNETSGAALDPGVCLLPKFRKRTLLERPQKEKKKIGEKKNNKMSSGHRTAVAVHSTPLSAGAIRAVCDCTLGAVNVKAAAGREKKKKGKKEETLEVRSGQERRNRASSQG